MKEKRYYCDWALSSSKEKDNSLISKVLTISFIDVTVIVVTVVIGLIYYNIMMHNHSKDLEAYSESAYKYLDEIADNVIGETGINVAAIPEDVVEYEITYKDGEIIFKYSIDNNRGKLFATSASMTVTLSKDFEILSKKPNFSSKEEYVKYSKTGFFISTCLFALVASSLIGVAISAVMLVALSISKIHKKMDMKKKSFIQC